MRPAIAGSARNPPTVIIQQELPPGRENDGTALRNIDSVEQSMEAGQLSGARRQPGREPGREPGSRARRIPPFEQEPIDRNAADSFARLNPGGLNPVQIQLEPSNR